MREIGFVLFVLLSLFSEVIAQHSYDDYQKSDSIFVDNFNAPDGNWELDSYSISGGWLSAPKSGGLALREFKVDQSRDFEMELSTDVPGTWCYPFTYLVFGDYLVSLYCSNQGSSTYVPDKLIVAYDPRPGVSKILDLHLRQKFHATSALTVNWAGTTVFTLRKIGGKLYLFVNRNLAAEFPFKSFVDHQIGVRSIPNVDFVSVTYLKKADVQAGGGKAVIVAASVSNAGSDLTVKAGGKYYAMVIGVSKYQDSRLDLDKPAADAKILKEILVSRYSFSDSTTFLLINPTRQAIMAEFFRLRKVIGPNDNLLIFYAGHGYWDDAAKQGYWWPADATDKDPSHWLSNSDVREQIRSIKSGHTLLISDACFSGGIFKSRSATIREATPDMQFLYKMPSRRAITSGTLTTVPDQSIFFDYLTKRLLDNQSKYLSSQQLFDSFRLAVINNSLLVPQDGVIAETGDEGGDFILILKN